MGFSVMLRGAEKLVRAEYWCPYGRWILKALFNNVFTFKNLSCMSLHAISDFDKVYKWSPEINFYLKSIIKCFKEVKIDKWPDLSYSFLPIDCCVRINGEPGRLFFGDIQS